MIDQYDKKEIYCRKLGHHLNFNYCRICNQQLPCNLITDCWFEYLPIEQFLKKNYSKEELEAIFNPQKSKMISILDLIEKAKNAGKNDQ